MAKTKTVYVRDFAACIIDVIEDFLEAREIELPRTKEAMEEAGDDPEENGAIIYGADFDELSEKITGTIAEIIKMARPDLDVDEDVYGSTEEIPPMDELSIDTSAGKLVAWVCEGSFGPQIGILHRTEGGDPTDLFMAEVREQEQAGECAEPGVIKGFVYSNPSTEDFTEFFSINKSEIEKAIGN